MEKAPLPLLASFLAVFPPSLPTAASSVLPPFVPPEFRVQMLPKRRRLRAESPHRGVASSAPPPARFPGVAIYLAEPRMGRSRRAFLTRLARSKGFRVLDAYRCAAPARARCWWDASLARGWYISQSPQCMDPPWPRAGDDSPAAFGSKPALALRGCRTFLQLGSSLD